MLNNKFKNVSHLYLYIQILIIFGYISFINYYNDSYSLLVDDNLTSVNDNSSSINSDSYLMNETNYFFVKYIHKSGQNASIINNTVLYDSNENELTTEFNNAVYNKTLTKEEENSFKKILLDINFFELQSSFPISVDKIKDNAYNSYNLSVTVDNKTNSVYWIDKEYTTAPSELYLVKDKIERWLQTSILFKQDIPTTILTPICGPVEGFNFNMMVNGFAPDRTVHWEMLDKDQQPSLLGYFETNSTGGFNETSYVTDILPGKYQLHLYDDKDNNAQEDWVGKETFTELSLPCDPNTNNSTNLQVRRGQD